MICAMSSADEQVARLPVELVGRLRAEFESLICALHGERLSPEAYALADVAVACGLWAERMHRPIELHPATAHPCFFDAASFWFVAHLESHWELIRDEVGPITDPTAAGFSSAGMDGSTVRGGGWRQVMLWDRGRRFDEVCERFPVTAEIVSAIPEATTVGNGFVMLSWLAPGTWIAPHCGPTNAKARTHLAVRTDDDARIRVGDHVRNWDAGRCFVFDDSFEHEVWHEGTEPRIVLIVDTPNPFLRDPDGVSRQDQDSRSDEILAFMSAMRLRRIAASDTGVDAAFTESMVDFMASYLRTRELDSVELEDGELRLRTRGSGTSDGRTSVTPRL